MKLITFPILAVIFSSIGCGLVEGNAKDRSDKDNPEKCTSPSINLVEKSRQLETFHQYYQQLSLVSDTTFAWRQKINSQGESRASFGVLDKDYGFSPLQQDQENSIISISSLGENRGVAFIVKNGNEIFKPLFIAEMDLDSNTVGTLQKVDQDLTLFQPDNPMSRGVVEVSSFLDHGFAAVTVARKSAYLRMYGEDLHEQKSITLIPQIGNGRFTPIKAPLVKIIDNERLVTLTQLSFEEFKKQLLRM